MGLTEKSLQLKELVSIYDSKWFLGDLSDVIHSGKGRANDMLGNLSSPMRQLYYLAGLNLSTNSDKGGKFWYDPIKWNEIVKLLNEIEQEYQKIILEFNEEVSDFDNWKKIREVAVPSFLTYFNQGPLNFEEQILNWVVDLYSTFDDYFLSEFGLLTDDFITFYENLDKLNQNNFQGHTTNNALLREGWENYTSIKSGMDENMPAFFKDSIPKDYLVMSKFMIDKGMKDRFYPNELACDKLPLEKVEKILSLLSVKRDEKDFVYYSETKPGNPLYSNPIFDIENGMYQVFEVKQVIHSIDALLENAVTSNSLRKDKYVKVKGDLLESNIATLFKKLFGDEVKIHQSYFVDGYEQDVLIIWNGYAFIIEAKGYNLREPLRTPEKAFTRIKDDFNKCIGYGYEQAYRIEKIFIEEKPLILKNSKEKIIEIIETKEIKECFSIIVNLNSFGLIQNDLSYLLNLQNEDDIYPWAVTFDDLEIFVLTLIAKGKSPQYFIDFLLFRETLHSKIMCSDELEICGGYLTNKINPKKIKYINTLITSPDFGDVFDEQYHKTMGFKNEKNLYEKQSRKFLFW